MPRTLSRLTFEMFTIWPMHTDRHSINCVLWGLKQFNVFYDFGLIPQLSEARLCEKKVVCIWIDFDVENMAAFPFGVNRVNSREGANPFGIPGVPTNPQNPAGFSHKCIKYINTNT